MGVEDSMIVDLSVSPCYCIYFCLMLFEVLLGALLSYLKFSFFLLFFIYFLCFSLPSCLFPSACFKVNPWHHIISSFSRKITSKIYLAKLVYHILCGSYSISSGYLTNIIYFKCLFESEFEQGLGNLLNFLSII